MQTVLRTLELIGSSVQLFLASIQYLPSIPRQWRRLLDQCFFIGYTSLPIILILSVFIGGVLSLQVGFTLRKIPGSENFLGSIVGLSMVRELGPVMTSFLLTSRVGSSITAELASMKVYQEVDALITMNIPPARILVMPRVVAMAVIMPVLTVMSNVTGWIGGMLVAQYTPTIDLKPSVYWRNLKQFVDFENLLDGLIKAEIFAVIIVLVCCAEGLRTSGGPREIGRAVTRAVVFSMISILILDYFVTKMLL